MFPKIMGTPKSSILIGCSIINHPFWDTPIFGNTHIYLYIYIFTYFLIHTHIVILRFWHTPTLHLPFVGLTSTCREFEPGSESHRNLHQMYHHDFNLPLSPGAKLLKEKLPKKYLQNEKKIHGKLVHPFKHPKAATLFSPTNFGSPLRIVVNGGNSPSPTRHHRGQPGGHRGTTTTGPLPPPLLPSSRGGSVVLSVDTRNPKSPLASGRSKHCRVNGLGFGKISVFVGPKKSMRKFETLIFTDVLKRFFKKRWWFLWEIFSGQLLRKALLLAKAKFEPRKQAGLTQRTKSCHSQLSDSEGRLKKKNWKSQLPWSLQPSGYLISFRIFQDGTHS